MDLCPCGSNIAYAECCRPLIKAERHAFEILDTKKGGPGDDNGQVEFIATFTEQGIKKEHRELSSFKKQDGIWYFTTGKTQGPKPIVRAMPKTGRNDPCEGGSGKKS